METTEGHLLGGRVRYTQPREGFRSGIEPVLLAAAIPARVGERVLEAGCGAGAALLCLNARVAGIESVGIERDPDLARLAAANATANGWPAITIRQADMTGLPPLGWFDHACANPPYHAESGTASPHPTRDAAKRSSQGLLARWAGTLGAALRPGGTLTMILPAVRVPEALAGFAEAGCHPATLLPLWPKPGRAAKLTLLQGIKQRRLPFSVHPGLTLHRPEGGYTPEADDVLREAAPLILRG